MEITFWLKHCCEFLGGERDESPPGFAWNIKSPIWGVWWGILMCVIMLFGGQSSKFIYIDF